MGMKVPPPGTTKLKDSARLVRALLFLGVHQMSTQNTLTTR